METGQLDNEYQSPSTRRELALQPATFSADSVESMAGIKATDLSTPANDAITDLLDLDVREQQIDMSAMSQNPSVKISHTDVEIPDDLFDFD